MVTTGMDLLRRAGLLCVSTSGASYGAALSFRVNTQSKVVSDRPGVIELEIGRTYSNSSSCRPRVPKRATNTPDRATIPARAGPHPAPLDQRLSLCAARLLVPGQVSEQVALSTRSLVVYGDLAAGLLALLADVLLQPKVGRAAAAVWLFVIVGVADPFIGLVDASPAHVYLHPLGTTWFVVVLYVPVTMAFEVPHRMLIWSPDEGRRSRARRRPLDWRKGACSACVSFSVTRHSSRLCHVHRASVAAEGRRERRYHRRRERAG
jgi:hypothetical protein